MESLANIDVCVEVENFSVSLKTKLKPGITALFGPSGSGKTTILRAIAGLNSETKGSISVADNTWLSEGQSLPTSERRVGFVFQQPTLFNHLSVFKNIEYGYARARERWISLEKVISTLGLEPLLDRNTESLSGGEKQRVAIGRALASQPQLLLMDEPMASLDRQAKQEIMPFIVRLHREFSLPILYVSHDPFEIAQLADEVIVIKDGKVVFSGQALKVINDKPELIFSESSPVSVIEGAIKEFSDQDKLTCVETPIGEIWVPQLSASTGERVRLQIHAKDVSVCLSRPCDSSISNIVPMDIQRVQADSGHSSDVYLSSNGYVLHAAITRRSVERLCLREGTKVYAQIKTVAVLGTEI